MFIIIEPKHVLKALDSFVDCSVLNEISDTRASTLACERRQVDVSISVAFSVATDN